MSAPQSYLELRSELQSRMSSLAPGQQRIARLLLKDPEGTALRSITETARLADVHQSSLVRFASTLGLQGYPALVQLCRDQLTEQVHLVRRFETAQQHGPAQELLGAVVEHDQQNLARTFSRIEQETWDRIIAVLAEAQHVHVMGLRKCLSVAQLLSYLLRMVRPGVRLVAPVAGELVDELRDLQPGDVFVGISIRRYTGDTVRAMELARQRGLHTIALTDDAASPLATAADTALFVETAGVTLLRSLSAFVSLAQAVATAVALQRGTSSRDELLKDEDLLESFGVYTEQQEGGST